MQHLKEKENQIEMRDGVKLHTIYYFPKEDTAEEKTYPVILTRTCYPGNDRIHRAYGEGLARRGYTYMCTSTAAAGRIQKENGNRTSMSGRMALTP